MLILLVDLSIFEPFYLIKLNSHVYVRLRYWFCFRFHNISIRFWNFCDNGIGWISFYYVFYKDCWFSLDTVLSFTNKIDDHDIAEILLKTLIIIVLIFHCKQKDFETYLWTEQHINCNLIGQRLYDNINCNLKGQRSHAIA